MLRKKGTVMMVKYDEKHFISGSGQKYIINVYVPLEISFQNSLAPVVH